MDAAQQQQGQSPAGCLREVAETKKLCLVILLTTLALFVGVATLALEVVKPSSAAQSNHTGNLPESDLGKIVALTKQLIGTVREIVRHQQTASEIGEVVGRNLSDSTLDIL